MPTTVVDEHLKPLVAAGFVAHTQEGSWVLAWSPETATVHDLYQALHLPFAGSWLCRLSAPWQKLVAPAMERIVRAEGVAMQMTLASLIGDTLEPLSRQRDVRRSAGAIGEKVT